MKYRKKPVVIEAFRITEETRRDNRDWPNWLNEAWNQERSSVGSVCPYRFGDGDGPLGVMTLEGFMKCDIGDWIIRGVKGELYPCKPDIFEATYEPAQPPKGNPMSELQQAAERVCGWHIIGMTPDLEIVRWWDGSGWKYSPNDSYYVEYADSIEVRGPLVAVERAADDETPIDEAWLLPLFGCQIVHHNKRLTYQVWRGDLFIDWCPPCGDLPSVLIVEGKVVMHNPTRGQLRRLLDVLGIESKEQPC